MPILRDFERRLEGLVDGVFAKTFRGGLQPVELAKRVLREMDTGKTVGVQEVWAPNHFVFHLAAADAERFQKAEGALIQELQQVVREHAQERGWGLVGPPEIELEVDESLGKGRMRCEAGLVEGEDGLEPSGPIPIPGRPFDGAAAGRGGGGAELVVMEQGTPARVVRMHADQLTIGRLPESDLVLADPGTSRRHAQIRRQEGGFSIVDLGSTNGTLVNGEQVQTHALQPGDQITIGNTVLEFRSG